MSRIKVLPVHVRNKIAAGEVIERPASVVKELIENSIDAGSSEIRIEILQGGRRLIKVSDNGEGMDREDALLCFERHATSKLENEDDLFHIRTMGFRGEALPSIASVSKVKLVTGLKDPSHPPLAKGGMREGVGISLEMHGGETREVKDSPASGTSLEVRDLFYNTPARKKFLKTTATELFHIIDAVTRESLSHYDIGFSLYTDTRETMLLPRASGIRERIQQVYGEEFIRGLIEVAAEHSGITMKAFVSNSVNFRNNKAHQYIFINTRPVKDPALSLAVYKAYEGTLPSDRHPVFFLFLDMDPGKIDFNVHPAKREVRFDDREAVFRFVHSHLRESVKGERKDYASQFTEPTPATSSVSYASPSTGEAFAAENIELAYRPSLPFIYLGDTFIAFSGKRGLTLLDHHAAHERILYEKFLKRVHTETGRLLFPHQVKLSHKEYLAVLGNREVLHEFGIELDDFGHDTVIIRSLPGTLHGADMRGILSDAASAVMDGARPEKSLKEALAARIACHSSVRGKEVLNQEEFSRLLSDLEETENPDQCPHGRPTRIFYSLEDLKKLFKRK